MLQIREDLPEGFWTAQAADLHRYFDGPTLIHLAGQRSPAVFVSILLHGNEDVGLKAIQQVLSGFADRLLPRQLLLFIGNIEAAKYGLRKLPEQEDFNRVWPGTTHPASPFSECMSQVVEYAQRAGIFVSLDLHNNTGTNPHYSCIETIDARTIQLALLFARTIVFFRVPVGVQTGAMSALCPAITCECGKVGDISGVERAANLIDACLHMQELPSHWPNRSDFHLLHSIATIKVNAESSITFGDQDTAADLQFSKELDHWNFRALPAGTVFGRRRPDSRAMLSVFNDQDKEVASSIFKVTNNDIVLERSVIPAMLTMNIQVIRDDCLGYFMEEYPITEALLSI
jgi:Succinylglutamate desuccinylase / Aspartoacylase family